MVDGQAWKKSQGWRMVMVGYAKIGKRGHNLYRVAMWDLQGVEGYGGGVEQGTEREFRKGGEVTQVGKR